MAAKKDYYKVLGVAENAPADEIKKAYRRLAKKYHPDVTGGDKAKEARFKEISEAYETVGDEKKRAQYDAERKNPFGAGGGFPGGAPGAGGGVHVDFSELFNRRRQQRAQQQGPGPEADLGGGFSDLFSEFFSGGGVRTATRGADVHSRLEIDLPTAAHGGDVPIMIDGKRMTVKIPAGIDEGQTIRLAGKGQPGRGAPGDLLLEIHVRPHPQLRRSGHDLEVDVPISVDVAVLGGKADVPTLEGKVSLTIPAGTSSGVRMRLRGKGVPKKDGTRGDLYAIPQIVLPKEIPAQAKDLIAEFAKLTRR